MPVVVFVPVARRVVVFVGVVSIATDVFVFVLFVIAMISYTSKIIITCFDAGEYVKITLFLLSDSISLKAHRPYATSLLEL